MKLSRTLLYSRPFIAALLALSLLTFLTTLRGLHLLSSSVPLVYDEAFNLQVPAILVEEGQYAARPPGAPPGTIDIDAPHEPFSVHLTTGPVLLLPLALHHLLLGPPVEARGREVALAVAVLLPLIYASLLWLQTESVAAFALGALYAGTILAEPWIVQAVLIRVFGEGIGLLCLLVGAFSIFRNDYRWKVGGGAFLAFAVLSKLLFLIESLTILAVASVVHGERKRRILSPALAGFLTPLAGWQGVQLLTLGIGGYIEKTSRLLFYLPTINGGVLPSIGTAPTAWESLVSEKLQSLLLHLVERPGLSIPFLASCVLIVRRRSVITRECHVWHSLALGGALHIAWFILLAPTLNYRHGAFGLAALYLAFVGLGVQLVYSRHRDPRLREPASLAKENRVVESYASIEQ